MQEWRFAWLLYESSNYGIECRLCHVARKEVLGDFNQRCGMTKAVSCTSISLSKKEIVIELEIPLQSENWTKYIKYMI